MKTVSPRSRDNAAADIAARRLASQGIEGKARKRPAEVVRWLVASQAQDLRGAKWALGLRAVAADDAAVERAIDDGSILRTHVLRPTWHFVPREDIRWLLALTAPRVHAQNALWYRKLELDAPTLRKGTDIVVRALEGERHRTRDELRAALAGGGIEAGGQRLAYLLMHAELEGVIASGPRRGKQSTYALLAERAPDARVLRRDEALAELVHRYFVSRGPATPQDFAKWSGLTIGDARRGLDAVGTALRHETIDGVSDWSGRGSAGAPSARAHLLSIYDEYVSSYRDRSAICDPAYASRLAAMGNALTSVLVVGGRVIGTWSRSVAPREVEVTIQTFRPLTKEENAAVRSAAERFASFWGSDRTLDLVLARAKRP